MTKSPLYRIHIQEVFEDGSSTGGPGGMMIGDREQLSRASFWENTFNALEALDAKFKLTGDESTIAGFMQEDGSILVENREMPDHVVESLSEISGFEPDKIREMAKPLMRGEMARVSVRDAAPRPDMGHQCFAAFGDFCDTCFKPRAQWA